MVLKEEVAEQIVANAAPSKFIIIEWKNEEDVLVQVIFCLN